MINTRDIIDALVRDHRLSDGAEYATLLDPALSAADCEYLRSAAESVSRYHFQGGVYLRGLIEVTNSCRNNCLYCGLRRDNSSLPRYVLTDEEIMQCCQRGYEAGLRTFVLQGGETGAFNADRIVAITSQIHQAMPDCAITLSLGECSKEDYQRFFDAGASRYLLRHETFDADHYATLHPAEMSAIHRQLCLRWLKEIGYQTGSGIMVGSPGQTVEHLVKDILFLADLNPEMIGIGPFLPHSATPFAHHSAGSLQTTLRLISIFRLMFPTANIPSTTALATLSPEGRKLGILAGANVVMPNISPVAQRDNYSLYDGKAHSGAEALEGIRQLEAQLADINYHLNLSRGDFKK